MGEVIRKMKDGRFIGWYIRFHDSDGKRKTRATKTTSFNDAKRILIEIEARVGRGKLGIADRPQRIIVAQLVERWVEEYDPNTRDRRKWSIKARHEISPMLPLLGMDACTFRAAEALTLSRSLSERYQANTIRRKLALLSTVFHWGMRKGIVAANPFAGVRQPQPVSRVEYLAREEVRQLLAAADARSDMRGAVFAVAIRLAVCSGLRVGEIFGLTWRDVDFSTGLITVAHSYRSTTKSGKTRHVPMTDDLATALRTWRSQCPFTKEGVVCPILLSGSTHWHQSTRRPCLKSLYKRAGLAIPASPWHALRHTFASHFLMSGGGLLTLKTLLGHSDLKMTSIYAHLSSDHLAAEVKRLKF
jgi:integrase